MLRDCRIGGGRIDVYEYVNDTDPTIVRFLLAVREEGNRSEAPAKGPAAAEPSFRVAAEKRQKSSSPVVEKLTETNDAIVVSPGGCAASGPLGQMTIFYCGKVNVYDEVSPNNVGKVVSSCMNALPNITKTSPPNTIIFVFGGTRDHAASS